MQFYDFENSIGFIINSVAKAFVRALDYELREHTGVTIGQWKVMVSQFKEIADRLNLLSYQLSTGWRRMDCSRER